MIRYLHFILIVGCVFQSRAQNDVTFYLSCQSNWDSSNLELGKSYVYHQDTVLLTQVRYYVSSFRLMNDDKVVWEEPNSFHLIDLSDISTQQWQWTLPENFQADHIQFILGIDSTIQHAGVQGGALDPMQGMYWTWQTGYIHLKLEGESQLCQTRKHRFQLHLGGFIAPNNAIQIVTLPLNEALKANITIDWKLFFEQWNLSQENEIMSPGEKAVRCSRLIAQLFQCK